MGRPPVGHVTSSLEATVELLFERLEQSEIPYAILRNYENFPNFGHDVDIVLERSRLDDFRGLLRGVARDAGWDDARQCSHRDHSPLNYQTIQTFHFFRFSSLDHLRVDVFHGSLSFGLAVFVESELLNGRRKCGHFTKVSPAIEGPMRLLQIHALCRSHASAGKIERYRNKAIALLQELTASDWQGLSHSFPGLEPSIVSLLAREDLIGFNKAMQRVRRRFLLRNLSRTPFASLRAIGARFIDLSRVFLFRPCGILLPVSVQPGPAARLLEDALNELVENNCLVGWVVRKHFWSRVTWRERKLLEREGVVVAEPSKSDSSGIEVIDPRQSAHHLAEDILQIMAAHHAAL